MSQPQATGHPEDSFRHTTLFYAGDTGFLEGTLPFIKGSVTSGEPILVAVASPKIELLREALDDDAEFVHFADMYVLGSNPACIIPAWRRFLDEHSPGRRPVRGIGEPVWAGRSDAELAECRRHESLLNVAFDGGQAWQLLCPYDLEALDDHIIEEARHSHPFVIHDQVSQASDAYVHGPEALGPFDGELPPPSTQPQELAFTSERLGSLRRFVLRAAADASLDGNRTSDLVLAVNELATNSLCHGGGEGRLRMWREADTLLCEVQDRGHITEPLTGRNPPTANESNGRGLWVVNHLCDLVQIRSNPTGSVVRVHMRLT